MHLRAIFGVLSLLLAAFGFFIQAQVRLRKYVSLKGYDCINNPEEVEIAFPSAFRCVAQVCNKKNKKGCTWNPLTKMCKACNDGPTPDIPNVQNAADPALVLYQPEVECLPHWLYFPLTFRCYFYDATYRTWEHARDNCTARGGEFTPVRNRDENDFVFDMSTAGSFGYLWFGGNDFKVENEWEFLDGTKLTWTNFKLNQPENSTTQQYLAIRRDINLWHDLICSSNNLSVCSNYPTLA